MKRFDNDSGTDSKDDADSSCTLTYSCKETNHCNIFFFKSFCFIFDLVTDTLNELNLNQLYLIFFMFL